MYNYVMGSSYKNKEQGMFYLVKSYMYDTERVEGICALIQHYCCEGQNQVAMAYYGLIKNVYEKNYNTTYPIGKLFVEPHIYDLLLPYYMIIVSEKLKMYEIGLTMYKVIFKRVRKTISRWHLGNLLFNLRFFIDKADPEFIQLFNKFLETMGNYGYDLANDTCIPVLEKYGVRIPNKYITGKKQQQFTIEVCKASKNILIYTGFAHIPWNLTYSLENALGGSETAVAYLSTCFPKDYDIYVCGSVKEEIVNNVHFVSLENIPTLIKDNAFHTIIVSRYISFIEQYEYSTYQLYIWGHDNIGLIPYGSSLTCMQVLTKWNKLITGCICLTPWHKQHFITLYPMLADKIHIINNGIKPCLFNISVSKVKNRFAYTSASDRGLNRLLQLWPGILQQFPDAQLKISSYMPFPRDDADKSMAETIKGLPSVEHLGMLGPEALYTLMTSSEYWLNPSYFLETSCITALEMLRCGVICLYYNVGGLPNTMDKYGFPVSEGNEIDTLRSFTDDMKVDIIARGKEYVKTCTWEDRYIQWNNLIFKDTTSVTPVKWIWYAFPRHYGDQLFDYIRGLSIHDYLPEFNYL